MKSRGKIIRDLTVGSVPRTLLSFSLPLFLSGLGRCSRLRFLLRFLFMFLSSVRLVI